MKKLVILFLVIAVLISCSKKEKAEVAEPVVIPKTQINEKHETVEKDNIATDTTRYPKHGIELPYRILTTGDFHGDEVYDDAAHNAWQGLFKNQTGYYIAETKLKISLVEDPVLDEDGAKTGKQVNTVIKDSCFLLLQGANLTNGFKVKTLKLSNSEIPPGDTLQLNYSGQPIMLYATGITRKIEAHNETIIYNYKLYIAGHKDGKIIKQLLVATPYFDGNTIRVLFAGDIDGDGFPDLIIDTSSNYNATVPTLYLSKPAQSSELLIIAGQHEAVGC